MKPIHERYLPFSEAEVEAHLAKPADSQRVQSRNRHGAKYFTDSVDRYVRYAGASPVHERSRRSVKHARQFEKDERFWTTCCLITLEKCASPAKWIELLRKSFGERPPFGRDDSWESLVPTVPAVRLEVPLPSPTAYLDWLKPHIAERNLIPYIIEEACQKRSRLEGFTHADAIVVCEETGFSIVVEAKATSDVSCQVSFDLMRNQIARNIDAMLEDPETGQEPPLSKRDARKTLFLLLTPQIFKENPASRLYGWLMREYCSNPDALRRDLPHRTEIDPARWVDLSRRLGWLTWEDCNNALPGACPWLVTETDHSDFVPAPQ